TAYSTGERDRGLVAASVDACLTSARCVRGSLTDEKHWVEHRHLDIKFDQRGQAIDGFSKVDRLGVEVHFFDFGVGSHHGRRAPERNREHSIGDQVSALNVGFMERLR
ncbi:hypothetical protein, partial [Pseudomonas hunanensis]